MLPCPYDVTYCSNAGCPFSDCDIHLKRIKELKPDRPISIADYGIKCKRYVGWIALKMKENAK